MPWRDRPWRRVPGLRPIKDQFYGDRSGSIEDPFGHVCGTSTRKEDLSEGG